MKSTHFLAAAAVVTFSLTSPLFAEEGERDRGEAARLMQKASEAKDQGRFDEANELAEQARRMKPELGEHHGRKERDKQFGKMKGEIESLRREGRFDEAERRMREMREQRGHRHDRGEKEGAEGPAKARHIMEAARHLREAGMHDAAEKFEQQARKMQENLNGSRKEREKRPEAKDSSEMKELRDQIEKLRGEVERIRQELKQQRREGDKAD